MRSVALGCALAVVLALAGCGDRERSKIAPTTPTAAPMTTVPGPGAGARPDPQLVTGQRVVVRSGCLACHRVGAHGNDGPGRDLAGIGARVAAPAIRAALVTPTSPMPSYRALPRSELRALVAYLSSLRDAPPGAARCRDGDDCG